jgi:hypothetical protein
LNAAAFDLTTATTFTSPDNVVSISLPTGWTPSPVTQPGTYQFGFGTGTASQAGIQVLIDEPTSIYEALGLTASIASPKEALETFKANTPPEQGLLVGEVLPVKIGTMDAWGVTISVPGNPQSGAPASEVDLRATSLEGGRVALVIVQAASGYWTQIKPALDGMLASLVLSPQNIPTATPTATLHPLLMTATAVQAQIKALTPTPTPVVTGTPAAGTAEATSDATTEAIGEPPVEPTAEATDQVF